jgi:hypothetical protein
MMHSHRDVRRRDDARQESVVEDARERLEIRHDQPDQIVGLARQGENLLHFGPYSAAAFGP